MGQHARRNYKRVVKHEKTGSNKDRGAGDAIATHSSAALLLYLPFLENAVQALIQ